MHTLDEYKTFLKEVGNISGLKMLIPDEFGLVSFRVEDTFNVNLQFIEANDKILCFIEVMQLPIDAPKEVYQDLLVGGLFGKDTGGGYFALESDSNTVIYNYLFDYETSAKDPEEFISTLENILQLCDFWVERIDKLTNNKSNNKPKNQDDKNDNMKLINNNFLLRA
ncbi:MAG: type III secretion system chaperone [Desulfovibrionaceae bacterium]|nr:type III secretion system chaperone [Desulfovibrionaceae bacterium]